MPACLLLSVLALSAAPGHASAAAGLAVRVERDFTPRVQTNDLFAYFKVVVTDANTGQPPTGNYGVSVVASNTGGETTIPFACGQAADNDPRAPRGIYNCTVIVDHGGVWKLVAVVNEARTDENRAPVEVTRTETSFEVATATVYSGDAGKPRVKSNPSEVVLLWAHTAFAGTGLICLALLSVLALPVSRRQLSSGALNCLERRFDLLLRSGGAATIATIGSGVYLLLKDTAYRTPFSPSAARAVFTLPYAKPYFLALGAKLVMYVLTLVAAEPIVRAARRQLHVSPADMSGPSEDRSPWYPVEHRTPARAMLKTPAVIRAGAAPQKTAATRGAAVAASIVVIGVVGIWMSITVLKYFHQLIEAASVL